MLNFSQYFNVIEHMHISQFFRIILIVLSRKSMDTIAVTNLVASHQLIGIQNDIGLIN